MQFMANTNVITEASRLLPAGPAPEPRDLVLEACRAYNTLAERERRLPGTADEWFAVWLRLRTAALILTGDRAQFVLDRAEDARHAGIRVLSAFYAGQGPACRFDDDELVSPYYRALYARPPRHRTRASRRASAPIAAI